MKPTRFLHIGFFAFVILATNLWSKVDRAAARPTDEMAKGHYASGRAYYQQGRYKDAIREFKSALELSQKAALYYNIALCWERLGDLEKAIAYRRKYLQADPKAGDADQVKLQIVALQKRLRATSVKLQGGPPGGAVSVNAESKGRLPLAQPIPVSPGSHKITVTHPGYETFKSTVAVSAGQTLVVTVEMEKKAALVKPPRPRPRTGAETRPSRKSTDRPRPHGQGPIDGKAQKGRKRLWTWISLGVGGGVLAGGLAMALLANHTAGQANKKLDAGDIDAYDRKKKTAKGLALGADISFALGGALVVTGVVLFFLEGKKEEKQTTAGRIITPFVGPHAVGLAAGGTF